MAAPSPSTTSARPAVAAAIVGFAFSGFFDGILLHQVLQWHHLLSLLPGQTWRELRNQIFADGLFHILMYIVAGIGLMLLWRSRDHLNEPGAGRRVLGGALLGFGLWNVVDVVGFHWLLGIHRVRVNVQSPLAYDLLWLFAFGLLFLLVGWRVLRGGGPPRAGRGNGRAAAAMLGLAAVAAGHLASLPPPNARNAVVVFRPGTSAGAILAAVTSANAYLLWSDLDSGLAAVVMAEHGTARRLYGRGALLVTRTAAVAGCLAWATDRMSVQGMPTA